MSFWDLGSYGHAYIEPMRANVKAKAAKNTITNFLQNRSKSIFDIFFSV